MACDNRIVIIDNPIPKGFGANHNAAFKHCHVPFFCPLNPDIELVGNPFRELIGAMKETKASLVAPLVRAPDGNIEDSMRRFPSLLSLVRKLFGGPDDRYQVTAQQAIFHPEWVAGMFMLFRSSDFARLGGFDERFFLYYEDVDICARIWKMGLKILACPHVTVIHDARRLSRRNLRYMRWHLTSLGLYFWRYWGRLPHIASHK